MYRDEKYWLKTMFPQQSDALLDKLAVFAKIRDIKKQETLLKVGDYQTEIYLLISGLVRCFFLDETQEQITDCFVSECGYPIMVPTLSLPSLEGIVAETGCRILVLPLKDTMELAEFNSEILWMYNQMLQKALLFHCRIKMIFAHYSASERYCWVQREWPGIDDAVSSKHIASFLGISPETLSRIRSSAKKNRPSVELMVDQKTGWGYERIKTLLNEGMRQEGNAHL